MEIALAVEEIYMGADWRRCDDYETLVRTWKDERPVPTFEELEDAWEAVLLKQAAIDANQNDIAAKVAVIIDPVEVGKLSLEDKVEYLLDVVVDLVSKQREY